MSEYTPTTEQIRDNYVEGMNAFYGERGASEYHDQFRRWLASHDAEVRASERERIIQDMQERSHPDDWGVPCVYVESYAKRLRGKADE